MVMTQIKIEDEVKDRLKVRCAERKMTYSEWIDDRLNKEKKK